MISMRSFAMLAGTMLFCACASAQTAQPSRADAEKDPVLKAMLQELDRSKNELQLKGFEKPFFIQLQENHSSPLVRKLARMGVVGADQRKTLIIQYMER